MGNIRQRDFSDQPAVLVLSLLAKTEYMGDAAVLALEPVLQIRCILYGQNGTQLLGINRVVLFDKEVLKAKLLLHYVLHGIAGNRIESGIRHDNAVVLLHVY